MLIAAEISVESSGRRSWQRVASRFTAPCLDWGRHAPHRIHSGKPHRATLCCYLLLGFNFIVATQIALPQTLHLLTALKQLAEGTAVLYTTILENDDLVGAA